MPNSYRGTLPPDARLTLITLGGVALRAEAVVAPTGGGSAARPAPGDLARRGDGSATLFEIGKPLALVTYLACAPDRTAAREHLIDLLWGDVEPDAAKHALRQTLWYLKKRLGDRPLVSGGDVLTLVGPLDCDRDVLLDTAERGDAEAVVQLYTGDFFPGFAAPGGAEFERWADAERQHLRSVFWRSAELLARQRMSSARMKDAQALARRVRDLDPMREAGWRLLFETIIAARDTVSAAVELEAFARAFGAEGIEPEVATRSMLRALRQGSTPDDEQSGVGSRGLVAELVGREHEFARIINAWHAARGGRPSHVHLLANAGLGKTRLLTDAHARLRATRARTVFVRATLGARDIPYGLVGELALALARLPGASGISPDSARTLVALNPAVSSLFPSAGADMRGDAGDALRRRTAALRELIVVLAEEQPLAVFVDDLQWADAPSRQVMAGISGTLGSARTLLVTAGRPTADIVHAAELTDVMHIGPLPSSAVTALLASIAALPAEPWAEQLPSELWHATAGSPLLILETLQLALERGLLERVDGEWNAPQPHDLLATLQAGGALRHRVERLTRPDRWLLTLLSVAGYPLATEVIAAAVERTTDEITLSLVALDQRGLVAHHGPFWSPSHDEIAAMTIELATDSAVRAAARVVGRALIAQQRADLRSLRQAGILLDRAKDQEGLAHAFSLFARGARAAGDPRDNHALAREFIGERMPALTRWLVRSLPVTHRLRLYSTPRQVAAAAAIVILPLMVAVLRTTLGAAAAPPEATLVVGSIGDDSVARLYRVPIRSTELPVGQTIQPSVTGEPDWAFRADRAYPWFTQRPDGQGWILERIVGDTGGIDVWEATSHGERRLTHTFGDDQSATVSPDGRLMAYTTAQWDERSRYDIAILDGQTGESRQLTHTGDSDSQPVWSPDGSQIAFARYYWDGRRSETCVVNVDGTNTRCFGLPDADVGPLRYWYDHEQVLVRIGDGVRPLLARVNVATAAVDTIDTVGQLIHVSPDGRWVACQCRRTRFPRGAYLVFPIDAPNRAVEIDLSRLPPGQLVIAWAAQPGAGRYAERLVIDAGRGPAFVGVPQSLSVVGLSPVGDTVSVGSVTWRSSDTTIATIDSLGTMTGRRAGVVQIVASAGGWRSVRQHVTIEPRRAAVVILHERWTRGIAAPWRRFGEPIPRVDSAADGTPGMLNGGEGSHSSGVYTEREYSTAKGLALDSRVSALITDMQWQSIAMELDGDLDASGLVKWNHRTAALPRLPGAMRGCMFRYPGPREGNTWGDSADVQVGSQTFVVSAPRVFKTGTWFDVRVQLFPDGRCGVAVNGVPVVVSEPRAVWKPSVRVTLYGSSMWTKVLVGETTLREGVPDDIDWSKASVRNKIPDYPPKH